MFLNAGYLNQSRVPIKDTVKPLVVTSCGTYRLTAEDQTLPTARPKGRVDYQLLYVASGIAHFVIDGKDEAVSAGTLVLYCPKDAQKYYYIGADSPEVFWVHFTGYDVKNILSYYKIETNQHFFHTGTSPAYKRLFQQMILELQLCRALYEDMTANYLNQIFTLMSRQLSEQTGFAHNPYDEIELAIAYFNENYHKKIVIEDYAASRNMSKGWFIRSFKARMNMTPVQYLLSIRLDNAQTLLEQTDYSISRIAAMVGYDNPLYFTRRFSIAYGMSPSEYRKKYSICAEK
ncbi:MAG: AraC family transcriptional regulator [Oscillospiraceae bacterium]|nr:AraC family transcriptional regulator [Oscillospiraceae bacterium]